MTSFSPARAELALRHRREDGRFGGRAILRDDDALAGGQPISLQHDRPSEFPGPRRRAAHRRAIRAVWKRAVGTP